MNYASIARATGHDVKTVKKYINMKDSLNRSQTSQKRGSKLDKYKEEIDSWLEADKQARKKQRHISAQRVFDRLAGIYGPEFNCSYRLVAAYVAEQRRRYTVRKPNFYASGTYPGEAQVDFGKQIFMRAMNSATAIT